VARDGIEPPTPAFSGLGSSRAIAFKTMNESRLNVPKTAYLLGQEWDKILAGQSLPSPLLLSLLRSAILAMAELPFTRLMERPPCES